MKITVNKPNFLKGLSIVGKFTGKSKEDTALNHIELVVENEQLEFKATDGEVYYVFRQPLVEVTEEGDNTLHSVEMTGNITLPSKFEEVLKKFPSDDVTIELADNKLMLSQNKIKAQVACVTSELPLIPKGKASESLTLGKKVFNTLVKNTAFASSDSDGRPVLKGINMVASEEGFRVVATDSHRLAKFSIPQKLNLPELNIPARAIVRVLETIDEDEKIELIPMESHVLLKTDNADIYILQLSGNYPNVEGLIQMKEGSTIVELSSKEFLSAVDRALPFSKNAKGTQLFVLDLVGEDSIKIYSNSEDGSIESELPATITKGSYMGKISINVKFVTDAVKALNSDTVRVHISSAMQPVYIFGSNDKLIQLVLPVRTA